MAKTQKTKNIKHRCDKCKKEIDGGLYQVSGSEKWICEDCLPNKACVGAAQAFEALLEVFNGKKD